MFVMYDKEKQRVPIKVWLSDPKDIEPGCLEQAMHLSNLPFVHHHVALMPDTHAGYGMPIGGVLATKGYIVPNAVGVDIGCGMCFIPTNIPAALLQTRVGVGPKIAQSTQSLAEAIVGNIMKNVPTGFAHHQAKQKCIALDMYPTYGHLGSAPELLDEIDAGYYQVGTLGGGNHFIELQEDEKGMLCIMLHSGSRNFGKKICDYFNAKAEEHNEKWYSSIPKDWELAFLPTEHPDGKAYIDWMNLALDFAMENRQAMMEQVKSVVLNMVKKYTDFTGIELGQQINAHHNYAAQENHFGSNVWVHRKGAIRVRQGEFGIIPGAMGSYSYIVYGQGNADSFMSASHGAGRRMGRKEATRQFAMQDVLDDLEKAGIAIGKASMKDVAEECKEAYKNIDTVIGNESDLIVPVRKLKTVAVIKG